MAAVDRAAPARPSFPRTKTVVLALALLPVILLADEYMAGSLVRPWKAMIEDTGAWSMRFLIATLCVSPLSRLPGLVRLNSFRRLIGLLGAFYAGLHVVAWGREYGFDWPFLVQEIVARKYLTIGGLAALLLVPLAATSADAMHRALGTVRWRRLHTLIYPAVIAAFIHYAMARGLLRFEVTIDAALLLAALAARLLPGAAKPRGVAA